jgi:hypothetical protein
MRGNETGAISAVVARTPNLNVSEILWEIFFYSVPGNFLPQGRGGAEGDM